MRLGGVKRDARQGLGEEHGQVVRRVTTVGSRGGWFWVTLLMESYMPVSIKSIIASGCLTAVILSMAACSPRRIPPMSISDLMEDRVALDGVLMKCNRDPAKARTDSECLNARVAIERLANKDQPAVEAKAAEEFERSREQLRLSQEKQRQEQEAKRPKIDAYHLPVVPVEPVPTQKDPQSPIVGKVNP
jgi:hypothetical protein